MLTDKNGSQVTSQRNWPCTVKLSAMLSSVRTCVAINSVENVSQTQVKIAPCTAGLTAGVWFKRLRLNLKQLDVSNQHMLPLTSDKHLNQSNFL